MQPGQVAVPLVVVLALPFLKILTTSLSIGSGGSGGIFGPGLVVGAGVGAAFWELFHRALPGMPPTPAPFVVVAMMSLFGGVAHAPLAMMLMVGEMTGSYGLLAPAMVTVSIASVIVGDRTIYTSQPATRADSPAGHPATELARCLADAGWYNGPRHRRCTLSESGQAATVEQCASGP